METWWQMAAFVLMALLIGMTFGWLLARARAAGALAQVRGERDLLAERDRYTASDLGPVRDALERVAAQVHTLERDRVEQFGQVGEQLGQVARHTAELGAVTATLSGALHSTGTRGTWGEAQLRRVLEHAGMLARCDFDEQVSATSAHDVRIRPDVLVRLPGGKCLVIDSKAPMSAFLRAHGDQVSPEEQDRLLAEHARALRGHVQALAAKEYWSAFTTSTPEMVVCFVPSDAVLAAALRAEPDLYDEAQGRKVVLASPATLLAMMRALAFSWQQDLLTENARELHRLGVELHQRIGTMGQHLSKLGNALNRSVTAYNETVGALEARVLVTTRRIHELDLAECAVPTPPLVEDSTRALSASELLAEELDAGTPTRSELDGGASPRRDAAPHARRGVG